jgi:ectoine hydroxylase-related dioxygenase (phytanoyl-CoA dioxygenase family)
MMLTVWLPLVDANKERGCMWVMPGVQRNGILKHEGRVGKSYLVIPDTELPAVEPICAEVKKGGVLLLTNMTPHVSFDNTSDVVRWSMDLRYQSAALPTNAAITRLPEEVAAQDEMEYPPACYPPEADFLVRSQQRPEQVVSDPTVFRAIRENHLAQPVTVRWETF